MSEIEIDKTKLKKLLATIDESSIQSKSTKIRTEAVDLYASYGEEVSESFGDLMSGNYMYLDMLEGMDDEDQQKTQAINSEMANLKELYSHKMVFEVLLEYTSSPIMVDSMSFAKFAMQAKNHSS